MPTGLGSTVNLLFWQENEPVENVSVWILISHPSHGNPTSHCKRDFSGFEDARLE